MPVQVIVLHFDVDDYRDRLTRLFPEVQFHVFHEADEAEHVAADAEVIMGLGHHIPRAFIAKAKKLKWVQALTTGTETLTTPGMLPPDVILTSTRGIHGPQMSELAFLFMSALARDFLKTLRNQAEAKWEQ